MKGKIPKTVIITDDNPVKKTEDGVDYRFPDNIIMSEDDGTNRFNKEMLKLLSKITIDDLNDK
ncbi:MAG TPA: hypothetical protein PLW78_12145 [bacterium]|nr:hypothetical protein [bacterium]